MCADAEDDLGGGIGPTNLYFVDKDKLVWTYSPSGASSWRFSRLSPCQREKNAFVLQVGNSGPGEDPGWTVQDQTGGARRATVIGTPVPENWGREDQMCPPLGDWRIWGSRFTLLDRPPFDPGPLTRLPIVVEAPFGELRYDEDGTVARLDVRMTPSPVTDESLEDLLGRVERLLRNLAQRASMVLVICSDVRDASVPSLRHVRRFLAFMQELGPDFVLVGRASAIIVRTSGLWGSTLLALIRMVQRLLPPPWPERLTSDSVGANGFLKDIAQEHVSSVPAVDPAYIKSCPSVVLNEHAQAGLAAGVFDGGPKARSESDGDGAAKVASSFTFSAGSGVQMREDTTATTASSYLVGDQHDDDQPYGGEVLDALQRPNENAQTSWSSCANMFGCLGGSSHSCSDVPRVSSDASMAPVVLESEDCAMVPAGGGPKVLCGCPPKW